MSKFFNKRFLTDSEIDYVLSDIEFLIIAPNPAVKKCILDQQTKYFIDELKSYQLYLDVPNFNMLEKLKTEITNQFASSFADAGDMVGTLAGQSIGQPITQCTLSGFHTTGIENVTTTKGIPKINEILNASDNPKNINCTIYLKKDETKFKDISDVRLWANKYIKEITVGYLLKKYEIIDTENDESFTKDFYKTFQKYYKSSQYNLLNTAEYCVRMYFDINKLWLHRMNFYKIANILEGKFSDACCVWTPENIGIMDVYVDVSQVPEDEHSDFFEKIVIQEIKKLKLTNCSDISDAFVRITSDGYVIDTNGSNLEYVFSLDEVDEVKTITNDIREIYKMFGIQATYEFLIQTIEDILAAEGTGVSKRHLSILTSVMTYTGELSSINRYGIQCQLSSTLSNSSFEQTLDNFIKASVIGTKDNTNDVSASIICGSLANIGTNMFGVMMDMSNFEK